MINFLFKTLIKGLQVGLEYDSEMKQDLTVFPPLSVVHFSILNSSFYKRIQFTSASVMLLDDSQQTDVNPTLQIIFKNEKEARRVFFGKISMEDAFSRHSIILHGDIYKAVTLVRLISKAEKYIFPNFISKKLMPNNYKLTKNDISRIKFYSKLIFWRKK